MRTNINPLVKIVEPPMTRAAHVQREVKIGVRYRAARINDNAPIPSVIIAL